MLWEVTLVVPTFVCIPVSNLVPTFFCIPISNLVLTFFCTLISIRDVFSEEKVSL